MTHLHLAVCSHAAAKFACEKWHYSRSIPAGKNRLIGVWENKQFIGAVIFGLGVNKNIGRPFGLCQGEVVELVRIALKDHKTHVTRIVKIALSLLKKDNPGIHIVVSYADPLQGHEGTIYRAGNWKDLGTTPSSFCFKVNGKLRHKRLYTGRDKKGRKLLPPPGAIKTPTPGKIRFGYALTKKGKKILSGGPWRGRGIQSRNSGSIPTPPLQSQRVLD